MMLRLEKQKWNFDFSDLKAFERIACTFNPTLILNGYDCAIAHMHLVKLDLTLINLIV